MKIWAIADLHLGFSTGKWMDVFGENWKDHHRKVERAWRERVDARDVVLHPGDFSWAMKASEVREDLAWLADLPGRKVLIKGNHDYWWPSSRRKLEELLPPGVFAMKKTALLIDGVPLLGVRGGDFHPREGQDFSTVEQRLKRERHELLLSVEACAAFEGERRRPPIAMFHYPPFPIGRSESVFTRIVEEAGCDLCVYGHLHTEAEWERVFRGERRGVSYRLVACDALGFAPLLVAEA